VIRAQWEAFNTILAYPHLAQLKKTGEAVYNWIQAFILTEKTTSCGRGQRTKAMPVWVFC
jgi:hypothetical protein